MKAPESLKKSRQFLAFLHAADTFALDVMLHHGVSRESGNHPDAYYAAITALAAKYVHSWAPSDHDDHCTYEELMAKVDAAYMLGLAVGLRLNATQAMKGGA